MKNFFLYSDKNIKNLPIFQNVKFSEIISYDLSHKIISIINQELADSDNLITEKEIQKFVSKQISYDNKYHDIIFDYIIGKTYEIISRNIDNQIYIHKAHLKGKEFDKEVKINADKTLIKNKNQKLLFSKFQKILNIIKEKKEIGGTSLEDSLNFFTQYGKEILEKICNNTNKNKIQTKTIYNIILKNIIINILETKDSKLIQKAYKIYLNHIVLEII